MKRIIVGVDLSSYSTIAVAHAVDWARRDGAEVVLALFEPPVEAPVGLTPWSGRALASYDIALREQLASERVRLGELRERWSGQGARVSTVVADGYPDDELPRLAEETGGDLIVVGSHGRSGIKRILLGSVAQRVVRAAHTSVLVARGDAPSGGYRHVVVGTDFTPLAKIALEQALAAAAPAATVDIVHCWQYPYVAASAEAIAPTAGIYAEILDQLVADGNQLARETKGDTARNVRFHVLQRPASRGLTDFATDSVADLVVVGSHGHRGIRRFILGSVAEATMRHAPCSTLIAR